jgi:hypothetical protein
MKNLRRNPGCSLTVVDGRGHVVVYGKAELVTEPAAQEKLQARFGPRAAPPRPAGAPPAGAQPPRPMGQRVMILLTPQKVIANRMTG